MCFVQVHHSLPPTGNAGELEQCTGSQCWSFLHMHIKHAWLFAHTQNQNEHMWGLSLSATVTQWWAAIEYIFFQPADNGDHLKAA